MVIYPEVQQKAQEEIDRIVGRHRMPTFEDRAALPYGFRSLQGDFTLAYRCTARYLTKLFIKIELTCKLCEPGLPHMLKEDNIYNGVLIPAGSTIIANIW